MLMKSNYSQTFAPDEWVKLTVRQEYLTLALNIRMK